MKKEDKKYCVVSVVYINEYGLLYRLKNYDGKLLYVECDKYDQNIDYFADIQSVTKIYY